MKRFILYVFIFLLCSYTSIAQTRVGHITTMTSLAEYKKYFADNILDIDPIEGIYDVQTTLYGYYRGNLCIQNKVVINL